MESNLFFVIISGLILALIIESRVSLSTLDEFSAIKLRSTQPKEFPLQNLLEEFGVSSLTPYTKIITDKGYGRDDPSVTSVFGTLLSTDFSARSELSPQEKSHYQNVFGVECNEDVISFILVVLAKMYSSYLKFRYELSNLESRYQRCQRYGPLMSRVKHCKDVRDKYHSIRRTSNDAKSQIGLYIKKLSGCVREISTALFRIGTFNVSEPDGTSQVECTEKDLLASISATFLISLYIEFLTLVKSGLESEIQSNCGAKCHCKKKKLCRRLNDNLSTTENLIIRLGEDLNNNEEKKKSCLNYLLTTKGSISNTGVECDPDENPCPYLIDSQSTRL
ncbi:hypothetical protein HWI79_307 [Cryptosporidium felis]|nr:hypothetical protein HWI79_307 [Cryptosporidium felis]